MNADEIVTTIRRRHLQRKQRNGVPQGYNKMAEQRGDDMTNNREILFRGFHLCEDGDMTIYVEGK